jgi:3-methylcrotonyl-CoA carboxylase beta subunit
MSVINSRIDTRSEDYARNRAAMRALVDDLRARVAQVAGGGGERARQRHLARGKLLPRERVEALLDPARPSWSSRNWPPTASTPTRCPPPGIITGIGRVAGRSA